MAAKRVFLTVMTAAATVGRTVTAASPVRAGNLACIGYLAGEGYVLTSARAGACQKGGSGQGGQCRGGAAGRVDDGVRVRR
jgi:hypothetical protein